ncbi:hypothetical protein [uncultured Deinococcus sp.]|uniref:hypothetical protein n=1 Tax=uncultured Deinococcus sp. TaxID=158789 RepID=UPI0025D12FB3|nr:hypothetical protein [uncultured Deinococcus sp.]
MTGQPGPLERTGRWIPDRRHALADETVALTWIVHDDDALYRVTQELLAVAAAPGRRDILLRRDGGRWHAVGRRGRTTEYPLPPLALAADVSHRTHLERARVFPLAVDTVPAVLSARHDTHLVEVDAVAHLRDPADRLAAALDARDERGLAFPWTVRARRDAAARRVSLALADVWQAASNVTLCAPRSGAWTTS